MKVDTIYLLYLLQNLSPVIGFIAYFLVVENVPLQNHFIFAYLVICFLADGFIYFQVFPAPVISNLHDICQFAVIMTIYLNLFQQRAAFYLVITIIVYLTAIIATITIVGLNTYHNYTWALSGLLIGIICIVFMSVVNSKPQDFANSKDLYNTLVMNATFLFYFLSTFAFFLFTDWMFKTMSEETLRVTWLYHNGVGFIKNIGLAVAIFLTGKAKLIEDSQGKVA